MTLSPQRSGLGLVGPHFSVSKHVLTEIHGDQLVYTGTSPFSPLAYDDFNDMNEHNYDIVTDEPAVTNRLSCCY